MEKEINELWAAIDSYADRRCAANDKNVHLSAARICVEKAIAKLRYGFSENTGQSNNLPLTRDEVGIVLGCITLPTPLGSSRAVGKLMAFYEDTDDLPEFLKKQAD